MRTLREKLLDHLHFLEVHDLGKRSTREMADAALAEITETRRELKRLVKDGKVGSHRDGLWRVLWTLKRPT